MIITKLKAVISLVGGQVSTSDDEVFEYNSGQTPPTAEAITAEQTRLQVEYDAQDYARNRKEEYDQLNQFEMQFDDDRDSTTTLVDKINEIKGRHPKP